MKTTFTYSVIGTLLNIQFNFLPAVDLVVVMLALVIIDFVTGVIKAVIKGEARSSKGYRKTVVKTIQYGGSIACSMVISYLAKRTPEFSEITKYSNWVGNGLLLFISLIELTSIFENMYAIDSKTPFSRYFISPLLRLLTLQLKSASKNIESPLNLTEHEIVTE